MPESNDRKHLRLIKGGVDKKDNHDDTDYDDILDGGLLGENSDPVDILIESDETFAEIVEVAKEKLLEMQLYPGKTKDVPAEAIAPLLARSAGYAAAQLRDGVQDLEDDLQKLSSHMIRAGRKEAGLPWGGDHQLQARQLHSFLQQQDFNSATLVLKQYPELARSEDEAGWAPLNHAACEGNVEFLRYLLGLDICVDHRDGEGETPLIAAIRSGVIEAVRLLLEAGARLDYPTPFGWCPIHVAIIERQTEIAELLVRYGADLNAPGGGINISAREMVEDDDFDPKLRSLILFADR